jgi:hypothetical protein
VRYNRIVSPEEIRYLALLEEALVILKTILHENHNTKGIDELVEEAILRSQEGRPSKMERQTFGDAILHGASKGLLKVEVSTPMVPVTLVNKVA